MKRLLKKYFLKKVQLYYTSAWLPFGSYFSQKYKFFCNICGAFSANSRSVTGVVTQTDRSKFSRKDSLNNVLKQGFECFIITFFSLFKLFFSWLGGNLNSVQVWQKLSGEGANPDKKCMKIPFLLLQEYKKNLRQTNGGEDFPAELLEEIYDNIRYLLTN